MGARIEDGNFGQKPVGDHELVDRYARKVQLDNLFRKMDTDTEATDHKRKQRLQEAGRLAAKELTEQR